MKPHLLIRPFAKLDIAEAALWYEEQQSSLGDEFTQAIGEQVQTILERPTSFPVVRKKEIRRALVNRFPYAIFFIARDEFISIIAVLHTSQDHTRRLRRRR
jgi:plasmid stabilization system protein ParE